MIETAPFFCMSGFLGNKIVPLSHSVGATLVVALFPAWQSKKGNHKSQTASCPPFFNFSSTIKYLEF